MAAKTLRIVKGGDVSNITIQVLRSSDKLPNPLTTLVSAYAYLKKQDGTKLQKALTVSSAAEGKLLLSLTGAETDTLEEGSSQQFEIELNYTSGTVNASRVLQDLTLTAKAAGVGGNAITIAYTTGATAGAEVVSVVGQAISVQIAHGVSTATQVKAALDASAEAAVLVDVAVSGTGSNPQTAPVTAVQLSGGGPGTTTKFYVHSGPILEVTKRLFE